MWCYFACLSQFGWFNFYSVLFCLFFWVFLRTKRDPPEHRILSWPSDVAGTVRGGWTRILRLRENDASLKTVRKNLLKSKFRLCLSAIPENREFNKWKCSLFPSKTCIVDQFWHFIVTFGVTSILPKLVHMLVFSTEKNLISIFYFRLFGFCRTGRTVLREFRAEHASKQTMRVGLLANAWRTTQIQLSRRIWVFFGQMRMLMLAFKLSNKTQHKNNGVLSSLVFLVRHQIEKDVLCSVFTANLPQSFFFQKLLSSPKTFPRQSWKKWWPLFKTKWHVMSWGCSSLTVPLSRKKSAIKLFCLNSWCPWPVDDKNIDFTHPWRCASREVWEKQQN